MTTTSSDLTSAMAERLALRQHWEQLRHRDLFSLLVLTVPPLLEAERVSVFVRDPLSGSIWLEAGTGVVERQIVVAGPESMVGRAIASGEVQRCSQLASTPGVHQEVAASTGFVTETALTLPLRSVDGSVVIGALQVLNKRGPQPPGGFDAADVDLLQQVAFAIQPSLQEVYERQQMLLGLSSSTAASPYSRPGIRRSGRATCCAPSGRCSNWVPRDSIITATETPASRRSSIFPAPRCCVTPGTPRPPIC